MGKNIGWFCFISVFVLGTNLYRKESFDQAARNVASNYEVKNQIIEDSIHAIDDDKLKDFLSIAKKMRKSN